MRTAMYVISAATRSSAECAASARMPRLPVSRPTMVFMVVSPTAASSELSAADRFSWSSVVSFGGTTPNLARRAGGDGDVGALSHWRHAEPFPPCQIRSRKNDHGDGATHQVVVNIRLHRLPSLTEQVAEPDEGARPDGGAGIGEDREGGIFQLAHARGVCGEMAHAGDEISDGEAPVAGAPEPGVRLLDVLLGDPQIPAVAVNQDEPEDASQRIAQRDAAGTAGERAEKRQRQREMPAKHQVAGEGQQGLVGNRQADDAQPEQGENRQVSVLRDPGEYMLLH